LEAAHVENHRGGRKAGEDNREKPYGWDHYADRRPTTPRAWRRPGPRSKKKKKKKTVLPKDTGEPVKLDPFFKGKVLIGQTGGCAVEKRDADLAEAAGRGRSRSMTVPVSASDDRGGGSGGHSSSRSRRTGKHGAMRLRLAPVPSAGTFHGGEVFFAKVFRL